MQRRLMIVYLSLTAVLLLATEIPLGFNLAMNNYHHLVIHQVSKAFSLASAAEATAGAPAPDDDWKTQATVYGKQEKAVVMLFDAQGRETFTTRPRTRISDSEWRRTLDSALAGESTVPLDYSFNISARPLFVAEPVLRRGKPVGAVATISPTASLRSQVAKDALILLGVALAGLLASAVVGIPLVRWSLAPARRLQEVVRRIAQGQYSVRASADRGPTELRELAEAVNGMTDRLVSVLEAQRSFVADASHQMRNPLTALRVRVEALEALVPEDGREDLAIAVSEADRLSRILDELLALANAAIADGASNAVDVRAVVEARAKALSNRAEEADVTIAVQGRGTPATCLPGALDQVLDVLLDNALGFSPRGGRVTVRIRSDDASVYVEVVDAGPGMSAHEKERATDRFWRGRQPTRRGGSGLGLAIAKALLNASGARLELDAEPHGLVARVVLPRMVPATALAGSGRTAVRPDGLAGERKPARQGSAGAAADRPEA
ncbi:MAG: HAMP domain-containing histidine kinase [Streptomyces sp.]|uniref:sensor histidine kinase n=1 Tax=Streptomyces sp. TaxID=1931 RepID=UPI0025DFA45B|nr:HAMP domain-containing sensor histidine kinase [Streptomyces sp.]MBW8795391.1 HAMP domain-containing histidine kinase [Streptomyces sp.]